MSDTTQYPNGIYEFTGTDPRGHDHWHNVVRVQSGWLEIMGDDWTCRVEDCKVRYLTPLVPSTELNAARQRIAELEAEVARLRQEQWTPVAQGTIIDTSGDGPSGIAELVVTSTGVELYEYVNDECDIVLVPMCLPDGYAICKRGDA